MKPLYLDGAATQVERDGPALRIVRPGLAERWFPLRIVSQVVSGDRVEWSTAALLACAEQGITVSFLDGEGAVLARLLGRSGERMELRQRLADFLLRPDWEALYEDWRLAMERMAVRSVARRAGLGLGAVPAGRDLRRMFRGAAESMGSLEAYERIGGQVHGLIEALVIHRLAESGLVGEEWGGLALSADLSGILFWDFQLERLAWLEDRLRDDRLPCPGREEVVGFFEARRARTERLTAALIGRLHRWLAELS